MWNTVVRLTTTGYNLALAFGVTLLAALIFAASWWVALPLASIAAVAWAVFRGKYPDALRDDSRVVSPGQSFTREEAIARAQGNAHGGSGS